MDNHIDGILWIAWEKHRRTFEICRAMRIQLKYFELDKLLLFKYPVLIIVTLFFIVSKKPKTLIIQSPSLILAIYSCILKKFFKFRLIVDTHNAGLLPDNYFLKKLSFIFRYVQRNSDITIVTNEELSKTVLSYKGKPFILPDKLPITPNGTKLEKANRFTVTLVSSYNDDEPYIKAIESLIDNNKGIYLNLTGNAPRWLINKYRSKNIIFTGYLTSKKYWSILNSSNVIMALTTRENCLNCSAYEAVAIAKPLILSDKRALKKYFNKGVIYAENTEEGILKSILVAQKNYKILKRDIQFLQNRLSYEWNLNSKRLKNLLLT